MLGKDQPEKSQENFNKRQLHHLVSRSALHGRQFSLLTPGN